MDATRRSVVGSLGGLAGIGSLGAVAYGSGARRGTERARALVAGSLLAIAKRIPGATIEAHGSAAVRRLLLNDMRDPDAVALADPRLFEGISRRATLFATNALVLAYSPTSTYANEVQRDWSAAIQRAGVRLGRTDPEADPLGYRTVMALRLAESRYGVNARRVLSRSPTFRETDLLNAVAGGKLDAAFCYRNMAIERGLPYVGLPDRIDFSDPAHADVYASVSYDVGSETIRGAPIRYAATAFTDAGRAWVTDLVTAGEQLRENGFSIPADYPRRDVRVGEASSGPASSR